MSNLPLKDHYDIVIIGAGPAGLAAAIELAKAGKDFIIIEKDERVGGLAKTYTITEGDLIFRTDNGPHRFFSKNEYLYKFISELLNDQWIEVPRQTRQFIDGKFFDYPIKPFQVLKGIGAWKVIQALGDYVFARAQVKVFKKPIKNFYDYAIANFGKTLAYYNIIGYTEKIWGIDTKKLHADWAKQRISGLNIGTLILNLLQQLLPWRKKVVAKSLVDFFYYPKSGTGLIYETIKNKLESQGYQFLLSSKPLQVLCDNNRIQALKVLTPEGSVTIGCNYLIESVHVDDFVRLFSPSVPSSVIEAADKLHYRSQIYLFITINKEQLTADQWIYFPEKDVPFARISEMKNFSEEMSPAGKTSIFIEFFCNQNDALYANTAQEVFDLVIPYFEKFNFFKREDVRNFYLYKGWKDYPIYDLEYTDHIGVIKKHLDAIENLWYIGRPGRFKYTNQDHSLEMGILAARGIIEGRRFNLDDIGAEAEYFEKGSIHGTKKQISD